MNPSGDHWRGKRVLVTGHSGFKGAWLTLWLHRLGAQVTGISLPPATEPNLFALAHIDTLCTSHFCDIRDFATLKPIIAAARPEVAFHLAAQPLVRASYREPVETFATNVLGTVHVLQALRAVPTLKAAVIVTTDKVYRNHEWVWPYRETDALGGHDPYSASKAAAEIVTASYRESFLREQGVALATARAGNVIGGGDWSEDRLIPDAIRAWQSGQSLTLRRPQATRPWQHVLEPLSGYLRLAEQLHVDPAAAGEYNFGPEPHEAASVQAVIERAQALYGSGDVVMTPTIEGPHEAGWLALEIAKARSVLGYIPRWSLDESVRRTLEWYRAQAAASAARQLCEQDIAAFESCA
ncbi:MAG: CDP-glucose 4,6-dehydratase [Sinobacteraceae bacterium]|nr:CDP-glucose 4,6-dehydratase [Nevskiaceae bacterium]